MSRRSPSRCSPPCPTRSSRSGSRCWPTASPAHDAARVSLRRHRARRVRRRHVVLAHRQHAHPAPLSRQGDDRARVARRAAAGEHSDDRASGATRVPRPPGDAAQPGVRARPHVHGRVLDVRMDPATRRHDGAARRRFIRRSRCSCCSRRRPSSSSTVASRRRAGGVPARRRRSIVSRDISSRRRRPRRRERKFASPASAISWFAIGAAAWNHGSPVRSPRRAGRSMMWHTVVVGDLRRGVCRVDRVRVGRAARAGRLRCSSCWPPERGCRRTSAPRSASSDSCAASGPTARRRLAWLEDYAASFTAAADLAGARRVSRAAFASITCRSRIPARRRSCSTT